MLTQRKMYRLIQIICQADLQEEERNDLLGALHQELVYFDQLDPDEADELHPDDRDKRNEPTKE